MRNCSLKSCFNNIYSCWHSHWVALSFVHPWDGRHLLASTFLLQAFKSSLLNGGGGGLYKKNYGSLYRNMYLNLGCLALSVLRLSGSVSGFFCCLRGAQVLALSVLPISAAILNLPWVQSTKRSILKTLCWFDWHQSCNITAVINGKHGG